MMSNIEKYMDITPEIQEALKKGKPVVAMESTILSHGMPYPQNLEFAKLVDKACRDEGAIPATMALIGGKIKVGLSDSDLEIMCKAENVGKVSRRDFATYLMQQKTGATTVASTMMCADAAGIKVFSTGGIGGVHRGGEDSMDISADLQELANTPVCVVCAGAKQILDIGRTLEYLETMGVPVVGNGTEDFPAFYCRESGYKVDFKAETEKDIARLIKTSTELGLKGGMLVGNPVPVEYAQDFREMEKVIDVALKECEEKGIKGKETTPFLLAKIVELTGGESLKTNIQLALNNARCAARIAVELAKL